MDENLAGEDWSKGIEPLEYTCIHIGHPEVCELEYRHGGAPYQLKWVDENTVCPGCGHKGTLRIRP